MTVDSPDAAGDADPTAYPVGNQTLVVDHLPATGIDVTALPPSRLAAAKFAYTTRYVAQAVTNSPRGLFLASDPRLEPRSGDVVLATVRWIGHHRRLESPQSRRSLLFTGDEIVVAYGHRYAPDQFEAEVPPDLGEVHLVAAGGMAGWVTATREGVGDPTLIEPVGLLAGPEGVMTLRDTAPYAIRRPLHVVETPPCGRPSVIAVVGTSMNSGKSTALACLTRGLVRAGLRVAAGKATGTGAGGDPGMFRDAGASPVLDFTDFGMASTYRLEPERVLALFGSLVGQLARARVDAVVVEIADGLYQGETERLLADSLFASTVDAVIFSAADALGASAGLRTLRHLGLDARAVTGRLTSSPLAAREARAVLDVPVIDTPELCAPQVATCLLPAARAA